MPTKRPHWAPQWRSGMPCYPLRRRVQVPLLVRDRGAGLWPCGSGFDYVMLNNQCLLIKLHRSMTSRAGAEEFLNAIRYRRGLLRCCQVLAVEGRLEVAVIRQGEALFTSLGPALQRAAEPSARQRSVKRVALEVGMAPACMGGHLLRTGGITLLAEGGLIQLNIQVHSGHKSLGTLATHVRLKRSSGDSPLKWLTVYP